MDKPPYAYRFERLRKPRFVDGYFIWEDIVLLILVANVTVSGIIYAVLYYVAPLSLIYFLMVVVFILSLVFFFTLSLPVRQHAYNYQMERYREELRQRPIPINGPDKFVLFCHTFIDDLKNKAPKRYEEAVGYLPEANFDNWYRSVRDQEDNYPYFRRMFLFRVWDALYEHQSTRLQPREKQAAAEEYSRTVLEEMGVK